jgi:phosphate-selective porin OprO and OprP
MSSFYTKIILLFWLFLSLTHFSQAQITSKSDIGNKVENKDKSSKTSYSRKKVEFGKGLTYMAKDSSFKIKLHFRMQNLMVVSYDDAIDKYSSQFLVRRSRLKFGGFVLNPNIEYKVEIGLANRDISVDKEDGNGRGASRLIMDAVLKWKFSKNWTLWVGQTKLPGNRERVISSANLQFVDRSLVNSRFNLDRDAGLQLRGKFKFRDVLVNPSFSVSQGEGRDITANNFGGYDYTARVDILPFGKFTGKGDYIGADLAREQKPKIAFGFTFDYNDGAVRQGGQLGSFVFEDSTRTALAENSLTAFMADMIFKYKGFSIHSEYVSKSAEKKLEGTTNLVGISSKFFTGFGYVAQAGYLFKNNVEIALRYTLIRTDDKIFSGLKDENEFTVGLSKYIVGHSLKVQSDFSRRTIPGADGAKYQFRMQMEMQF